MPDVSILIPAYRADYLDACVASALAQTHRDFEVIISDDCPTDDVERVVAKWIDERVRYVRNPTPRLYATNRDNLVRLARGRYLKFLFDDDMLYPHSVETLFRALESTGGKLAFHQRHYVDTIGRVLDSPSTVPAGTVLRIAPEAVISVMIGSATNAVGEPTNVLIDAEAFHAIDHPFEIEGRPSRFLADVAMIYNFARHGHELIGVGAFGSAFRQHPNQNSSQNAPTFAAGVFEWELLARSARAANRLSAEAFRGALGEVRRLYRVFLDRHPLFARFLALDADDAPDSVLNRKFLETLDLAYFEIEVRRAGPLAQTPGGSS
jgi:glycosyltransferase involved in cell wall biosynthesis